jgi:hypothetical protein
VSDENFKAPERIWADFTVGTFLSTPMPNTEQEYIRADLAVDRDAVLEEAAAECERTGAFVLWGQPRVTTSMQDAADTIRALKSK